MQKINVNLNGIIGLDAELAIADVSELSYLKRNARYFEQQIYMQLSENITNDNGLTSVPLVAKNKNGKYDIISGNHRVKAAVQSGQKQILVLCIDSILPHDKLVAIQLSHNALAGSDDTQILKQLYDEISQIDLKKYSGIDESIFDELAKLKTEPLYNDPLSYKAVTLMFLPAEIERIKNVFDYIKSSVASSEYWLMRASDFDRYLNDMEVAKGVNNVVNTALAFTLILDKFEQSFEPERMNMQIQELMEQKIEKKKKLKTMPIVPIFDTFHVPVKTGRSLIAVIQDATARGLIKSNEQYKILDIFVDNYNQTVRESAKQNKS